MTGMPLPGAPHVLAIVQAGGQGSRMDVLTRERAKPALPYAGSFQLVDLALSSIANSGVDDVWVSVQYMASSLDEHLQSGRPWDLDRDRGGYRRLVPEEGGARSGFSSGNADDLSKISDSIEALAPDVVITLSADQVFRCDLREVVAQHRERGSSLTIVTTEVPKAQAGHKAVVTAGEDGRVSEVLEKPEKPPHGTISAEILCFDGPALLQALQTVRLDRQQACEDEADSGLGDLAEHLIPHLVATSEVHTYPLRGYWKDMGRPSAYLAAHRDLVKGKVDTFDDLDWPIRSNHADLLPALVHGEGEVHDSYLSPGCDIRGEVRGSVLGPGVRVAKGAIVEDSVIFGGVVIEAGAQVRTSIIDERVRIGRDASVGATPGKRTDDEDIALVGRDSTIGRRVEIEAGARLEPGTTA